MAGFLDLALANLATPMVLCFALGALAAAIRSDLEIPEAIAKGLAIYLMFAIGFKGGVAMRADGGAAALLALLVAALLSLLLPLLAFALLRLLSGLDRANAGAVAAHYGSVSVVTFVTAAEFMRLSGLPYPGYLVAMMAVMETPAIVTGILLARGGLGRALSGPLLREVLANGSVVLLVGGFLIGWATGDEGMRRIGVFVGDLFNGALCLFLLEMGLVATRQLRSARLLSPGLVVFAFLMPLAGAAIALALALPLGLGQGGAALFATLAASASYIAVPAAMRLAVPEARPGLYVTLSLGLTFPFNVALGIPLYTALAQRLPF